MLSLCSNFSQFFSSIFFWEGGLEQWLLGDYLVGNRYTLISIRVFHCCEGQLPPWWQVTPNPAPLPYTDPCNSTALVTNNIIFRHFLGEIWQGKTFSTPLFSSVELWTSLALFVFVWRTQYLELIRLVSKIWDIINPANNHLRTQENTIFGCLQLDFKTFWNIDIRN